MRDGRGVEGAGYVPPGPSKASTSQRQGFGIDVAVSVLERAEHSLSNVCSELQKVPTTVERLSCISGSFLKVINLTLRNQWTILRWREF